MLLTGGKKLQRARLPMGLKQHRAQSAVVVQTSTVGLQAALSEATAASASWRLACQHLRAGQVQAAPHRQRLPPFHRDMAACQRPLLQPQDAMSCLAKGTLGLPAGCPPEAGDHLLLAARAGLHSLGVHRRSAQPAAGRLLAATARLHRLRKPWAAACLEAICSLLLAASMAKLNKLMLHRRTARRARCHLLAGKRIPWLHHGSGLPVTCLLPPGRPLRVAAFSRLQRAGLLQSKVSQARWHLHTHSAPWRCQGRFLLMNSLRHLLEHSVQPQSLS